MMPNSCSAYNCTNRFDKSSERTFHRFPFTRPHVLKRWVAAMRRKDWYPTRSSSLCSDHFLPDDFEPEYVCPRRRLKCDAVPSKFDFAPNISETIRQKRCKQKLQEKEKRKSSKVIIKTDIIPAENIKKEVPDINFSAADIISCENKLDQSTISREISSESSGLQICKETEDASDSEEIMDKGSIMDKYDISDNSNDSSCADDDLGPLSSEEILKRKLDIMTALYEKSQKKLKLCQEQCKRYVKQVVALEEVIDNLKQINSVTDYN